jgi:hypothetical protein
LNLDFDSWVSGDYSAATDNLSLDINRLCLESLLNAFQATEVEKHIALQVLGPHLVHYPDRLKSEEVPLESFLMKNGQLMGSLLSFPVLCAINLVAYWSALEEYTGRTFRRCDLPVLVNGDDICFMANNEFYQIWKKWIKKVGFELSLGKNYISSDFITLNSEGFIVRGENIVKLPALNVGLLIESSLKQDFHLFERQKKCSRRAVGQRSANAVAPISDKITELLESAHRPERAWMRYKHYSLFDIDDNTEEGKYNVFAPRELGGLGAIPPPGFLPRFTYFQQILAGASHRWFKELRGKTFREFPRCPFQRAFYCDEQDNRLELDTKRILLSPTVVRHVFEPNHFGDFLESERAIRVAPGLLNLQLPGCSLSKKLLLRTLTSRKLSSVFSLSERIKEPLFFDLQLRKNLEGPTDDASLPDFNRENMAEMATDSLSLEC